MNSVVLFTNGIEIVNAVTGEVIAELENGKIKILPYWEGKVLMNPAGGCTDVNYKTIPCGKP